MEIKKNIGDIILMIILSHFHIATFAQNVGVCLLAPLGKLHIKGSADVPQLIIDANSAQSNLNPLIKLRKSDGLGLGSLPIIQFSRYVFWAKKKLLHLELNTII